MTLHNIALHLIGVGLFFALLCLLILVCRIADRALVPPSALSSRQTSIADLSIRGDDPVVVPMLPITEEERKRFIY